MRTIDPKDLAQPDFHRLMIGSVGPRPVAFASTVDRLGNVNLSPFSFFNVFTSNPPTLVFGPNRNRHSQKKHTLLNLEEVPEVVINMVNYRMVEQMSLASAEYERGVNEFVKAGFTQVPSERVRPPRVGESPVSYECTVRQILSLGDGPGGGTLIICEVVLAHFQEEIFDERGTIDPSRIDLVGRMGGDWYCRAHGDALFEVSRPKRGIGFDNLPEYVKNSAILTGNDLGRLASQEMLPTPEEVAAYRQSGILDPLFQEARYGCRYLPDLLQLESKRLLSQNKVQEAWLVLLQQE
ncbi:flavin reductase family protein [Larkinella soli]|uniref:flavin reductase family protein n=1 Tax=Larkinella soli TaxID=1770527 RepID=UPI000FFB248A|nr:flavin reductase family protein [Larkinella soli]